MVINVYEGFQILDIVERFESLIWTRQFWDFDNFVLDVAGTARNVNLLQKGRYLARDIDVTADGVRSVMVIEARTIRWDTEKGWILSVSGRGLKHIVGRRVVWSQTNLNGTVEAGIRQVINENIISPSVSARAMPGFVLDDPAGVTDTLETQIFGVNIADWLKTTGQLYGIGWDVYMSGGHYVFSLMKGTDRSVEQSEVVPVVFSPEYDNLAEAGFSEDQENFFNVVLVGGEGEGTAKRTASVGSASGMDRIEKYVDGSSVSSNGEIITEAQYTVLLQTYGREHLATASRTISYDGKITQNAMYALGEQYFLGDIVTVKNDNGIQSNCRITEEIFALDQNGQSIVPTFEAVEE